MWVSGPFLVGRLVGDAQIISEAGGPPRQGQGAFTWYGCRVSKPRYPLHAWGLGTRSCTITNDPTQVISTWQNFKFAVMPNSGQGQDLADMFPIHGKVGKGKSRWRSSISAPSNEAPSLPSLGFVAWGLRSGWEEWLRDPTPGNAKTKCLNGLRWHFAF